LWLDLRIKLLTVAITGNNFIGPNGHMRRHFLCRQHPGGGEVENKIARAEDYEGTLIASMQNIVRIPSMDLKMARQ